ncbi:hypothetical protein AGMMS49992_08290 [Clostridia bacterium]|nr:hypothetical protein AGMMS49992_08290 [Clostridia bacterium]
MQKIDLVWGRQQEFMLAFGTAGESGSTELVIDVTKAEARIPHAVYSIHMRRADGWTYPAEVGLRADADGEIGYVLGESDLAVSGMLWLTVTAEAPEVSDSTGDSTAGSGEKRAQWSVVGWVSQGAYEGAEAPRPDWVSEVLAFANAFSGISARIALLPPNARPAAAFVQEADGMKLVLSLPDTSGIGDGGHAIFSAEDEADLLNLTDASIGDQAITPDGDVFMCVEGDPTQASAWVRLSEDSAAFNRLDGLMTNLQEDMQDLSETVDSLEQTIIELGNDLTNMEEAVGELAVTLLEAQQLEGMLKASGSAFEAAVPGMDYSKPPITIDLVITADMWLDQSVEVYDEQILEGSIGIVRLAPGATADQYAMYGAAQPRVSAQWDGGLTISAAGTVPEEELAVQILILS